MDGLVDLGPVRTVRLAVAMDPLHAVKFIDGQQLFQMGNLADTVKVVESAWQASTGRPKLGQYKLAEMRG